MSHKEWKLPPLPSADTALLQNAGYTALLSAILSARGIKTPEAARLYLERDDGLLNDPLLLNDMDKAVRRIRQARLSGEKIAIYGDYDVDGITSSCMLCDYFRSCGCDCEIYIPDRLDEGYGLNCEAVKALSDSGVGLLITVDCGITAVEETALALSLGMDIIITDHHECPEKLPEAAAVIDPKRQDSTYPFDALAGVGVAFKLICALEGESKAPLSRYSDLVAVGTVADVMPLMGENRALVFSGLEKLKHAPRPGFAALLEQAGALQKPINASTVSFILAPRINAAGRLCKTEVAVGLIMSEDEQAAQALAVELCELNHRRQVLETKVWDDAMSELESTRPDAPIVIKSSAWHPGVVGIAASRLAEAYGVPTIVICMDGGMGKGSCRSYGSFNLFDALSACSEHLESFGGHAFAAGLNIREENIDAFQKALAAYYKAKPPYQPPLLEPELLLDSFEMLTIDGVLSLDKLEPCGSGNPRPLMCVCDARLEQLTPIGGGKHLRLRIGKGGICLDCVFFAHSAQEVDVSEGELIDLCFAPHINDFRSQRSVQLLAAELRPSRHQENCRSILSGGATLESMRVHRPKREQLARTWHTLMGMGGSFAFSLADIAEHRGELSPETLCLCLRIFAELGLVSLSSDKNRVNATVRADAEKTALDNSPLFCSLWQNQ